MRSASDLKPFDSNSNNNAPLPNGILQCGKCWSFITTTSRVQNVYSCSNLILIGLSGNVPSICISSEKQLCVPGDQFDTLGELSVFQNVACRRCCVNLGRLYLATTQQLDMLRDIPLLHEHSLQYQDAETCEVDQLSSLVQPIIIKDTTSEKNNNFQYTFQQQHSPFSPNHTRTNQQRVFSSERQPSLSSEQKNNENQKEQPSKVSILEGAKKMEETINTFGGSLKEFDERIGTSEQQIGYLNSQIEKLLLLIRYQQQQPQWKDQFKQQNRRQSGDNSAGSRDRQLSTPRNSRPRTPEAFSNNQQEQDDWKEKE